MPLPAAQTARVNDRGDHQDQQIATRDRHVVVHHPGVDERGEGEEKEAQERDQKVGIRVLQIGREKEHQRED